MLLGIFPIYKKTKQNPNKHNTVYTALAANSCFITKLVSFATFAYSICTYYMFAQRCCPASENTEVR